MFKNKKILVTGGAGFIGSNLCKRLVTLGVAKVASLDNYFTGSKANHTDGVNYINGNTDKIEELLKENFDIVFHLGEYSRVEQSYEDIEKVWSFNLKGTYSVLEYCRKVNAKIVYAGSSTKFSDYGLSKFPSPYAWSKANNTELVKNYGNWFNLNFAITYFYNVYGNSEISVGKYATVVGLFSQAYKNSTPLKVVKPGTQKRFFTHIDDIIDALILIGNSGKGDGFGIGSDESYSIIELAKLFSSDIEFVEERKGNRFASQLKTEKTKQLGWIAKRNLKDYINNIKNSKKSQ